jgi:hypothetical protein
MRTAMWGYDKWPEDPPAPRYVTIRLSKKSSSGNRVGEGAADLVTGPPTTHVDNMQTRTIPLSLVPRVDGDAPPFRDCIALNTRAVLGDVNVAPTTAKHAPGQFCYRQATSIMPRHRPRSLPGQDLPSYAAADVPRPAKMPDRGQVHVAPVVTAPQDVK